MFPPPPPPTRVHLNLLGKPTRTSFALLLFFSPTYHARPQLGSSLATLTGCISSTLLAHDDASAARAPVAFAQHSAVQPGRRRPRPHSQSQPEPRPLVVVGLAVCPVQPTLWLPLSIFLLAGLGPGAPSTPADGYGAAHAVGEGARGCRALSQFVCFSPKGKTWPTLPSWTADPGLGEPLDTRTLSAPYCSERLCCIQHFLHIGYRVHA